MRVDLGPLRSPSCLIITSGLWITLRTVLRIPACSAERTKCSLSATTLGLNPQTIVTKIRKAQCPMAL
jgi:hypothetical protein